MRTALFVLVSCALGCGSDGNGSVDAAPTIVDAALAADAPRAADAAPVVDAPAAQPDAPALGRLCATTAVDGGPGSCPEGVCCSAGGSTICTLESDCPAGPGYKACNATSECQGSICCRLPSMQFCTKASACTAYNGMILP